MKSPFIKGHFIVLIAILVFSIFLPKISFAAKIKVFLADVSVINAKCQSQEDFAREFELKKLETEREVESSLKAKAYYYLAVLRYSQMQALKAKGTLESARKYVSVNNIYYRQSLDYLSKSLALDLLQDETGIHLLKLLIYAQLHDENMAGIEFSRLSNSISDIKDEANKLQLYKDASQLLYQYHCNDYGLELYEKYFESLIASESPDAANEVLLAADSLLIDKSYSQAFKLHRQYLKLIEDSKLRQKETLITADKYFEAKSYREAALLYNTYLTASDELNDYALFKKAQSYDEVNQVDMSITAYEELIEACPESKYFNSCLEALEDNYIEVNDYTKLIGIYKKIIEVYPDDGYEKEEAHYQMAYTMYLNEDYQMAKEAFVEFIEKYPDSNYRQPADRGIKMLNELTKETFVEAKD